MAYSVLINKSMGFSQSLSMVSAGGDTLTKNEKSGNCRLIEMFCIKAVSEKCEILYHKVHISVISDFYKHIDFQIPNGLMISSLIFLKQSSFSGMAAQFD